MTMKNRSKLSSEKSSSGNVHATVCRSRSIDSVSANTQIIEPPSPGGEGIFYDNKLHSTATLVKKIRTIGKRLSRTSNYNKHEQTRVGSHQNDNIGKSGGDDSEVSSAGEEGTRISFTEIPTSNPDLTVTETSKAILLKEHRSLPPEKTPSIITSPPPPPPTSLDLNEKKDHSGNSHENSNLSKTWSPSTFTGAQLRGTCSLEYTEHMKDKSHKRKAHLIDLRKDDVQQQQLSPNTIPSPSKHSISTPFKSYYSYTSTLFTNKGVLT